MLGDSAKAEMSAELADLRAGIEAALAALKSELAAARADLHAARAELENFRTLHGVSEAAKSELAGRRASTEAAAAQRDADTPLTADGIPPSRSLEINTFSIVMTLPVVITAGWLSDWIGRKLLPRRFHGHLLEAPGSSQGLSLLGHDALRAGRASCPAGEMRLGFALFWTNSATSGSAICALLNTQPRLIQAH